MATYKGINGFAVQSVATDPSPLDEGQVWYNNATYAFKLASLSTVGTFASGGNMNTARAILGGAGTQTAAIGFGGETPGGYTGATELYNGTSWTTSPATLNTARLIYKGNAGIQTSALAFSGYVAPSNQSASESFNGTSWTNTPSLNTAARARAGVGASNTSALCFGGFTTVGITNTESWNGSSWTTVNSLNSPVRENAGSGIQTAAISFGGNSAPGALTAQTESYNGTTWTTVNSLNTARQSLAGAGIQTAALAFGGTSPDFTATELWNGTSWTSNPTGLSTARNKLGGAGTQTAGLAFGGEPVTAVTEEWTGPGVATTKTITTS
jgi:hypothetical protein